MTTPTPPSQTRAPQPMPPDRRRLGSVDGVLKSATGDISYHFQSCYSLSLSPDLCRQMARHGCQYIVMMMDVLRLRMDPKVLEAASTRECVDRLRLLLRLVAKAPDCSLALMMRSRIFPPVEPRLVDGMVLNENKVEMTSLVRVAGAEFWINLAFSRQGTQWICVVADIGQPG
ncbi:hypothetical protein [Bifidobacterium choloepi]|uniref:Uncharacterized protein n=1 Tax=Bifidobacterium choloepi TaxID=2614131 RepID=A0A6I5N5M0_9BIFI|nr:hypothetical protein [Bifidobacterium choloepi]NEG69061.1 hypothetical protein [Bifidobacterium choloepi]